ncbi:MAG: sulfatase [Bryobacteraceae bacterium]|nr:sulfatase [Bryobacteraceae bacterium]
MKVSRRAVLGAGVAAVARAARAQASAAPNIVFLISDDHSWTDLGCYGNRAARTPNLDRLAKQGTRFTHCFVTSPQCSPNRSAIFTGMPAHQTATSRLHAPMPAEQTTFLEGLRERGYFLGAYRKVHQGAEFDKRWDFYRGEKARFSEFFSARPKDRPFFLQMGFTDPHRPYPGKAFDPPTNPKDVAVPRWLPDTPEVRRDLADYLDEIARMDGECGEVLRLLEEQGLERNTMVVFTADNGMPFPPRAKGTLYEYGIRVPLLVRWPGRAAAGVVSNRLVSHVDLPVTWLEAAGAAKPGRMRGVDILNGPPRREIFSERNWHDNFDLMRAIRTERHKLIYNAMPEKPNRPISDLAASPTWGAYQAAGKAGRLSEGQARELAPRRALLELYDLERDPDELTNLAEAPEHEAMREELLKRLSAWMDGTNDFLPPPFRMFEGKRRPTL